jgi:hypothetical protein
MSANEPTPDAALSDQRSGLPSGGLTNEQLRIPSAARMYDYYLGGHHNLAIDRQAADEAIAIYPDFPLIMQANRGFLRRAVVYLAEHGIDRFLDIGSGIPTVGNVHQIAQQINPSASVVYVDIDPVAVAHSAALLDDNPNARIIEADLRQPETILSHPAVRDLFAAGRPVALILAFVVHFVTDDEQALAVVRRLRDALPPHSYVVISHGTAERMPRAVFEQLVRLYRSTSQPVRIRSLAEIEPFFEGLELVEPGLVYVPLWRPEETSDLLLDRPEVSGGFAAMGRCA